MLRRNDPKRSCHVPHPDKTFCEVPFQVKKNVELYHYYFFHIQTNIEKCWKNEKNLDCFIISILVFLCKSLRQSH